jgi:hypothetical protein
LIYSWSTATLASKEAGRFWTACEATSQIMAYSFFKPDLNSSGLSCKFWWQIQIWLLRFGWESQRTGWSFGLVGQGSGLGFPVFCQENWI